MNIFHPSAFISPPLGLFVPPPIPVTNSPFTPHYLASSARYKADSPMLFTRSTHKNSGCSSPQRNKPDFSPAVALAMAFVGDHPPNSPGSTLTTGSFKPALQSDSVTASLPLLSAVTSHSTAPSVHTATPFTIHLAAKLEAASPFYTLLSAHRFPKSSKRLVCVFTGKSPSLNMPLHPPPAPSITTRTRTPSRCKTPKMPSWTS